MNPRPLNPCLSTTVLALCYLIPGIRAVFGAHRLPLVALYYRTGGVNAKQGPTLLGFGHAR